MRNIIVFGLIFFMGSIPSSWALTENDFTSGENEQIFELVFTEGGVLQNGILVYHIKNSWYLPFLNVAEALGIYIKPNSSMTEAKGFIIDESEQFELDLPLCKTVIRGNTEPYSCDEVFVYDNEIFVNMNLVSHWLPVDFSPNLFKSQLQVITKKKLPIQLKLEREENARMIHASSGDFDPGFPRVKPNVKKLAGPSVDQRLGAKYIHTITESTTITDFNTVVGWQTFGYDSYFHASGSTLGSNPYRLSFSKKDPDAALLGSMSATEMNFFDVDMPILPLVTAGRLNRGFVITNEPLGQTSTFSSQNFQGNILPNWEVELYQNNILINRQSANVSTGRYSFTNIPLLYGLNQFKLIFYGPYGQKKTETHSYLIGSNLKKPGIQTYRFGLGISQNEPVFTGVYNRGLSDRWTISLGTSRIQLRQLNKTNYFGTVGLSGVTDNVFLNLTSAMSSENGVAHNFKARVPFQGINLGAEHSIFRKYQSDLFNFTNTSSLLINETSADLNFTLPTSPHIGMTWDLTRKEFENTQTEIELRNRASTNIFNTFINHEWRYTFYHSDVPYRGKLDLIYSMLANRIRLGFGYNKNFSELIEMEHQFQVSKSYNLITLIRNRFDTHLTQVSSSLARLFNDFALQLNTSAATDRSYDIGLSFIMSLTRDPYQNTVHWSPLENSTQGSASINVFNDENGNGLRDDFEKGLKDISITNSQNEDKCITNEDGYCFLERLQPYQPVDISVASESISNPFLKSKQPGYRLYPRPSCVSEIKLPFIHVGMIDGMITYDSKKSVRPARNIEVTLLDSSAKNIVSKTKTDSDGIFIFEAVPSGEYYIQLQIEKVKGKAEVPIKHILIPVEGAYIGGQNFILPLNH